MFKNDIFPIFNAEKEIVDITELTKSCLYLDP